MNKTARGGKKGRTKNDVEDEEERTSFDRERFWEVPLQLESNINLKKDSCLVPAEQITLRERDFDESSQIDASFDEVCLFGAVFLHGVKLLRLCVCHLSTFINSCTIAVSVMMTIILDSMKTIQWIQIWHSMRI